jgi:hypothetical protein
MVRICFIFFIFTCGLSAENFPAVNNNYAQKFLNKYCYECHGGKKVKGKIDFRDLTFEKHSQDWTEALHQIEDGEMPPEDELQPSKEEKLLVSKWIKQELLKNFKESNKTQLRLMSINEYAATVRDLFGYDKNDFDPSNNLFNNAEDRYDTIAKKQNVTSYTIDSYFKVADILVKRYVREQWQKPKPQVWNVTNEFLNVYKWNGDKNDKYVSIRSSHASKLTTGRNGKKYLNDNINLADIEEGTYKFTVDFSGHYRRSKVKNPIITNIDQNADHAMMFYAIPPQKNTHAVGRERLGAYKLTAPLMVKDGKRRKTSFITHLGKGFVPYYAYYNGTKSGKGETNRLKKENIKVDADHYLGPQLRLYSVKIEGPFYKQWPPKSFAKTFGQRAPETLNKEYFLTKLKPFVAEAFKRPVENKELTPFMELFDEKLASTNDFWTAAGFALKAVLISPDFLYINDLRDNTSSELTSEELATRLSYFLWGSLPDDSLLKSGKKGVLNDERIIALQTERLLRDPKSEQFTKRFLFQWLELDNMKELPPSADKYKRAYYQSGIQFRVNLETEMFFDYILDNNLKMDLFLDSDFTFLDDKLAKFYGLSTDIFKNQLKHPETSAGRVFSLSNADKSKFKKYKLPEDSPRGGLLGQATVLIATSNGVDTNPVKRGIWILENLLHMPPPPAPEDVPAIEQSGENKSKSLIDLLAFHRENQACAKCHDKIDPMGVPLEGFDPIGRVRTKYENKAIVEAVMTKSDGRVLNGVRGVKDYLLENKEHFYGCLTRKLMEYAIGRELEYFHEEEIDHIVERTVAKGAGLRTLVKEITKSDIFRSR